MSDTKQVPQKRFRSLKSTITAAFLALSLFVLLLSTSFELYISFQTQQKVISNQQQLVAQSAARAVSDFIQGKFRVLNQASEVNNLAASADRRVLVMNKLLGLDPSFRQLFLINATGTILSTASRLSNLTQNPLLQWQDPLLLATRKGSTYVSSIYIDPTTNEPQVLIAVPSTDVYRDIQGAFVAEVNLKFMWDLVAGIQVGNGGRAFVVDRQGDLIAFTDTSRVLARENESTLPEVRDFISESETSVSLHNAIITKGIEGTSVVSSHVTLGTPDWAVVVEVPVREAYATFIQELLYSFLVIVFSGVLAVVSGIYFSRRITRPIIQLGDAAKQMSAGTMRTNIEVAANNEVGQLAGAFNEMASQIERSYQTLEEKVKDRTVQLDQNLDELKRTNKLMVDRELKMIELKKEIADLKGQK